MTVYYYKATDQNGKYVEGDINAPNYKGAVQKIRKLNYFPVKVSEGKKSSKLSAGMSLSLPVWSSPIPTKDLMTITQQLATLIDSGLTLDDALFTLIKLAETGKTKVILSEIRNNACIIYSLSLILSVGILEIDLISKPLFFIKSSPI